MKKSVILAAVLLVCFQLAGLYSAREYVYDYSLEENQAAAVIELNNAYIKYAVPKAKDKNSPVIDGVLSDGEWDGALQIVIDGETSKLCNTNLEIGEGTVINVMWSDERGLLFGAYINDLHKSEKKLDGDFVQICLFSSRVATACEGTQNLFLDFHPFSDEGRTSASAFAYENYLIKDRMSAAIASSNGSGEGDYYMEWALSWDMLGEAFDHGFEKEYQAVSGEEFIMFFVAYDTSKKGSTNELFYTASSWMNPTSTDIFVLVDETSVLNGAVASDKSGGSGETIGFLTVPVDSEPESEANTGNATSDSKDSGTAEQGEQGKAGNSAMIPIIIGAVIVVAAVVVAVIVKKKK